MAATDVRTPRGVRVLAIVLAVSVITGPALADEASGRTSGAVSVRGNYWWERSTRVIAPETAIELETATGTRLQATYLLDAITSASVAAGALTDQRFTEIRHDVQLGGSHELHLAGDRHYRPGALVRLSREPDYTSFALTNTNEISLDERNTVLRFNLAYAHDEVRRVFREGSQTRPGTGFSESFDAFTISGSVERTLRPDMVLVTGLDFTYVAGYLASPYRQVSVSGVLVPENHPDTRARATLWGRLQWAIPRSGTAFHVMYRAYVDSWHIGALSPEVRVYQALGDLFVVRLRYRYYAQSASSFYSTDYTGDERYVTADPKMSRFHVHEGGIQTVMRMSFLAGTRLDALRTAELDLVFDLVRRSNRFGDGVLAQVGVRIPFR